VAIIEQVFWFIIALGVLVTIHEYGHYYVARRCGVKVLRFSVGFGKVLLSRRNKEGTEFTLAAIPLGGYVKMLDEREGEVDPDEKHMAFTQKPVLARIAIVAAGPIANFILAVLLFWVLTLPGTTELTPVVGAVEKGSIAEQAGLEAGQTIVAVDGAPTPTRQALAQQLLNRLGETGEIEFTVQYPKSDLSYQSTASLDKWLQGIDQPEPFSGLGLTLFSPKASLDVRFVQDDSPASKAGLLFGDSILSADNITMTSWDAWVSYVQERPGQLIDLQIRRDGSAINMPLTPMLYTKDDGTKIGRVGIGPKVDPWPESMILKRQYGVMESFVVAVKRTKDTSAFVLLSLKKLIVGEISTKNLSGPFTIAKVASASASAGWQSYVGFIALLSIFLGVMNLLPIPVLDGGHLMYYLIELFKGSPLPDRVQLWGYQAGMVMVLGIMAVALYNDVSRML